MSRCFICCLKVIHCFIIVDTSSALETRTTTCNHAGPVRSCTKVAGGTTPVFAPTSTVTTTTPATRCAMTVSCGMTGSATGSTRWDSVKWKSGRFPCEQNDTIFFRLFVIHWYSTCHSVAQNKTSHQTKFNYLTTDRDFATKFNSIEEMVHPSAYFVMVWVSLYQALLPSCYCILIIFIHQHKR